MDQRDIPTWIAIELTHLGETKVDEGTIIETLLRDLNVDTDFGIFIPAITYLRQHQKIVVHLMQGYVFVHAGLSDVTYFALERKPYIHQVMSSMGGPHKLRTLSVISDAQIKDMRRQLRNMVSSDLEVGAAIKAIDGTYRNLEGFVLDLDGDYAAIQIELRSLNVIARVPRIFLETV